MLNRQHLSWTTKKEGANKDRDAEKVTTPMNAEAIVFSMPRMAQWRALIFASSPSNVAEWRPAEIVSIKDCDTQREARPCEGRDAIFFVHGIFGNVETFSNGSYHWPEELAADFPDVDVFVIKYDTQLLSWLNRNVATFDEIAEVLISEMQGPVVNDGGTRILLRAL